jgi:hypothetical protein
MYIYYPSGHDPGPRAASEGSGFSSETCEGLGGSENLSEGRNNPPRVVVASLCGQSSPRYLLPCHSVGTEEEKEGDFFPPFPPSRSGSESRADLPEPSSGWFEKWMEKDLPEKENEGVEESASRLAKLAVEVDPALSQSSDQSFDPPLITSFDPPLITSFDPPMLSTAISQANRPNRYYY